MEFKLLWFPHSPSFPPSPFPSFHPWLSSILISYFPSYMFLPVPHPSFLHSSLLPTISPSLPTSFHPPSSCISLRFIHISLLLPSLIHSHHSSFPLPILTCPGVHPLRGHMSPLPSPCTWCHPSCRDTPRSGSRRFRGQGMTPGNSHCDDL